jgi:tRNA pseudouridine55 synthase
MNGILIIDKPGGMTSHDVVNHIRAKFSMSRVGHLGTLDPMATGVLPVCMGKATRMGQFIPNAPKVYTGEIRFGFSTNTFDREGSPTSEERPLQSSQAEIEQAMESLTGRLDQIPPPFSAKKIRGVASYKLARKGKPAEMAPASVEVQEFKLLELRPPLMKFRVVCSPGTYVRSLAHDLGRALGCGGHLSSLQRIRSGDFFLEQAIPLDRVSRSDLIPMERLLESWPRVEVSGAEEAKVVHGNPIGAGKAVGSVRIFNKKGEFIAVGFVENDLVHPGVVLTSITSDESDVLGCILEKETEA